MWMFQNPSAILMRISQKPDTDHMISSVGGRSFVRKGARPADRSSGQMLCLLHGHRARIISTGSNP